MKCIVTHPRSGLIENLPQEEKKKLVENDLRDHACHIDFAHIVALSVAALDTHRKSWPSHKAISLSILNGCILVILECFVLTYINISKGRASYQTDRARWRNYCRLRRTLQVYWLPALQDIRTALHLSRSQANTSATVSRAELQDMLKLWEELGRGLNLSNKSRENDTNLTSYVTADELALGCFYPGCLCYGEKPLHGIRRICKGCWSAYYCGPKCQKKLVTFVNVTTVDPTADYSLGIGLQVIKILAEADLLTVPAHTSRSKHHNVRAGVSVLN